MKIAVKNGTTIRTFSKFAIPILGASVVLACASMPLSNSYKELESFTGGIRGGAGAVLGSYGVKTKAGYERNRTPDWLSAEAYEAAVIEVDQETFIRFGGSVIVANEGGKIASDRKRKKAYKMVLVEVREPGRLTIELNEAIKSDPKLREFLSKKEARIITGTATVYDYEQTEDINFEGEAKVDGTVSGAIGSFEVAVGKEESTSIKLENGTVGGYQFSRFCWDCYASNPEIKHLPRDNPGSDSKECRKLGYCDRYPTQ